VSEIHPETPAVPGCGCPQQDGKTYHARGTCTDPVVARLDWYTGDPLAPAPELAAAMAETRQVRDGYASLCKEFAPSPQAGWSARISLTVLNRHRTAAGLDGLSRTPSNNREDLSEETATVVEAMAAERARYRKALEAIAECRAGMPYPDAARQALGGDHA
jgi:hypothetical protein